MKDFWQKLPNKGQPPNSGHRSMYQLVLYSEVPLYTYFNGYFMFATITHAYQVYRKNYKNQLQNTLFISLK